MSAAEARTGALLMRRGGHARRTQRPVRRHSVGAGGCFSRPSLSGQALHGRIRSLASLHLLQCSCTREGELVAVPRGGSGTISTQTLRRRLAACYAGCGRCEGARVAEASSARAAHCSRARRARRSEAKAACGSRGQPNFHPCPSAPPCEAAHLLPHERSMMLCQAEVTRPRCRREAGRIRD